MYLSSCRTMRESAQTKSFKLQTLKNELVQLYDQPKVPGQRTRQTKPSSARKQTKGASRAARCNIASCEGLHVLRKFGCSMLTRPPPLPCPHVTYISEISSQMIRQILPGLHRAKHSSARNMPRGASWAGMLFQGSPRQEFSSPHIAASQRRLQRPNFWQV